VPMFRSAERLYLTEDRKSVVSEGDANARFLLVAEGGEIPEADAKKYGLTNSVEAPTQMEQMQRALESAQERGAVEEAEIHERNIARLQAQDAHAETERKSIRGPAQTKQVKAGEDK
jgi:hypothetical protein